MCSSARPIAVQLFPLSPECGARQFPFSFSGFQRLFVFGVRYVRRARQHGHKLITQIPHFFFKLPSAANIVVVLSQQGVVE
jgi:hypothetical protein